MAHPHHRHQPPHPPGGARRGSSRPGPTTPRDPISDNPPNGLEIAV
ncbi:hypothetical protein Tco_0574859, partial [Tanacetum coccineum]